MPDHDLFVCYDNETQTFEPKRLKVVFFDRGQKRVKFDDSEQYWREFVNRWWHHDNLSFTPLELTPEQQARLDDINAQSIDMRYLSEVAEYIQHGVVSEETAEPYLATMADDPTVVDARIEVRRQELRQRLAEYRFEVETNGTELADGTPVVTTREAQAQLTTVHQTLKEGFQTEVNWKGPNGWVVVTLAEMAPIAQAVSDHVQKSFSTEKAVDDLIDIATEAELKEFDVVAEYDQAFAV